MQVYALMALKHYEGFTLLGVYDSVDSAKSALLKYVRTPDEDGYHPDFYYDDFYAVRMELGEDATGVTFERSRLMKLEV